MINRELADYIEKCRAVGQTDEQIKSALKQSGWPKLTVEEGFKPSAMPMPMPPPVVNSPGALAHSPQVVHSMAQDSKSGNSLIIAISSILVLLAMGAAGFYYYTAIFLKQEVSQTDIATSTPIAPPADTVTIKSAKDSFLEFKAALEGATSFDDAIALNMQYTSTTTDTKALGYDQVQVNLSAEQKSQLLAMATTTPPLVRDIVDISEEIRGSTGRLVIKTKDNTLCGLPVFLEDNQWKFGIIECGATPVAQANQLIPQNLPASAVPSCGSIKFTNLTYEPDRTAAENAALDCMVQALTNCDSKALTVVGIQSKTYAIARKEGQYCNISREAGLKTICKIPTSFISKVRKQYNNSDDVFLFTVITSIDDGDKVTDGYTGKETVEYACQ
ncbi:MAG: hypothetical protein Q7S01_01815 [bacterium]|nr:hypothetical protein [bacterium]